MDLLADVKTKQRRHLLRLIPAAAGVVLICWAILGSPPEWVRAMAVLSLLPVIEGAYRFGMAEAGFSGATEDEP